MRTSKKIKRVARKIQRLLSHPSNNKRPSSRNRKRKESDRKSLKLFLKRKGSIMLLRMLSSLQVSSFKQERLILI